MPATKVTTPAITQWIASTREMLAELHSHEVRVSSLAKTLDEAQQATRAMQLNVGKHLNAIRAKMPKRGTAENGWGAFLEAVELDDSTAWRYMEYAKRTVDYLSQERDSEAKTGPTKLPTYADVGLDKRGAEDRPAAPPPRDEDAPREADPQATDSEDGDGIDRDTWCTPKWITEALGKVDLDPCANERSHVQAKISFHLERGDDGLVKAPNVGRSWRVFINPPYSDVPPWVEAYSHTRFVFLLKLDPSTKWFEALIARTELVLIPKRTRVQFEPPPGVAAKDSKANPFPHALFFAKAEDAPEALLARCYVWRVEH